MRKKPQKRQGGEAHIGVKSAGGNQLVSGTFAQILFQIQ